MTPDRLAALHATAFTTPRPWSAAEFAELLASPLVFLLTESEGFLLGRVVADEAELLTLAVAPAQRRQGLGRGLVAAFLATAKARGAGRAFLEVSTENHAATALYQSMGFVATGHRKAYFRTSEGGAVDGLVMTFNLQA